MRGSRTLLLLLFVGLWGGGLGAGELSLDDLIAGAKERDGGYRALAGDLRSVELREALEDYERGPYLSVDSGDGGVTVSRANAERTVGAAPRLRINGPEALGTTVEVGVPTTIPSDGDVGVSGTVRVEQDLNRLLGIEERKDVRAIERENGRWNLRLRMIEREEELTRTILTLLRTLAEIEKRLISTATELEQKRSDLDARLAGGLIQRGAGTYLSAILEIRELEQNLRLDEIEASSTRNRLATLTGFTISELPAIPPVALPEDIPDDGLRSVAASRREGALLAAQLTELRAPAIPQWTLSTGLAQGVSSPDQRRLSVGLETEIADSSFSLQATYGNDGDFLASLGVRYSPTDRRRRSLREAILEEALRTDEERRSALRAEGLRTIDDLRRDIVRIEFRRTVLEANREFVDENLQEIAARFENGLIPERELIRARDRRRLLDIDTRILAIDRTLLARRIEAQFIGVER